MTGIKTAAAIAESRTVYTSRVKSVSDGMAPSESVIKKSTNGKLGRRVVARAHRGFPIYTVTLEERATCPRSCAHWADCYGNNLHLATRYRKGRDLECMMADELETLQARHPDGFLVRLHVLGDFYSRRYVALWSAWLDRFPALHTFGYTGHPPSSATGRAIDDVKTRHGNRFALRYSGAFDRADSALSMDNPKAAALVAARQAFICPQQTGKVENCAACALCWTSPKPVAFLTH